MSRAEQLYIKQLESKVSDLENELIKARGKIIALEIIQKMQEERMAAINQEIGYYEKITGRVPVKPKSNFLKVV